MTNPSFEEAFPVARELAHRKALAAVHRCGFTRDDREDIEAQLLLTFVLRAKKFDSSRSSLKTFASQVMDREVASILRYRLAGRRLQLGRPELVDGDAPDHLSIAGPSTIERQEFWLDVAKVMRTLPLTLRKTVIALRCGSPTEASQVLGIARSVVYQRIAQIRETFLAAGIGPTYFNPGGGR